MLHWRSLKTPFSFYLMISFSSSIIDHISPGICVFHSILINASISLSLILCTSTWNPPSHNSAVHFLNPISINFFCPLQRLFSHQTSPSPPLFPSPPSTSSTSSTPGKDISFSLVVRRIGKTRERKGKKTEESGRWNERERERRGKGSIQNESPLLREKEILSNMYTCEHQTSFLLQPRSQTKHDIILSRLNSGSNQFNVLAHSLPSSHPLPFLISI